MTQLLVSVRDAAEARAALAGGADVIDVKEPTRGSLGRANEAVWEEVAAACAGRAAVSFALGELGDWEDDAGPVPAVPAGAAFVKLGLAATGTDWEERWEGTRERFDAAAGRPLPWAAVAYADARAAAAPGPVAVVAAAIRAGCAAVLIDTFQKDGRGLFDHLPDDRLAALGERSRRAGLRFALAGSLRLEDVPRALGCGADVIAVRGAACDGARTDRVGEAQVRALAAAVTNENAP